MINMVADIIAHSFFDMLSNTILKEKDKENK